MMPLSLATLLIIPFCYPIWYYLRLKDKDQFTPFRLLVVCGSGVLIAAVAVTSNTKGQVNDQQPLTHKVSGKERVEVRCVHMRKPNCSETLLLLGGCRRHDFDVRWQVSAAAFNKTFNVFTRDAQGLEMPKLWSEIEVGQPFTVNVPVVNYMKALPERFFQEPHFKAALVQYDSVFGASSENKLDYPALDSENPKGRPFNLDRVIAHKLDIHDLAQWNSELELMLARLPVYKKANAIVVLTEERDPAFALALQAHWLGAKPHDTVVVIGASDYPQPQWVRVFALSKNEAYQRRIEQQVAALDNLDPLRVLEILEEQIVQGFEPADLSELRKHHNNVNISWLAFFLILMGTTAYTVVVSRLARTT